MTLRLGYNKIDSAQRRLQWGVWLGRSVRGRAGVEPYCLVTGGSSRRTLLPQWRRPRTAPAPPPHRPALQRPGIFF